MGALPSFHPRGDWIVASTQDMSRLTFWPLRNTYPVVVDGYGGVTRPLAFSPDGRWLATKWGSDTLRLWPLPGNGHDEVRPLDLPTKRGDWYALAFDPHGKYLFVTGEQNRAYVVPLDGCPPRKLPGAPAGPRLHGAAVSPSGRLVATALSTGRSALTHHKLFRDAGACRPAELLDLTSGESRALPAFGECVHGSALGGSGSLAVTGDREGIVRVGKISEGEPHLLVGHEGPVTSVAVSPDRRWVATTGQDNTLRLWPMPDLSQPPLHTLPHAELLAKLRSLTNLRTVRDPESPNGYRIDLGPFPGWQTVPTW